MEAEVISLIAETLEIKKEDITRNTNLIKDLDIESLDLVDLVVAFENKYNLDMPDKDIKNLQTVDDIIKYLESNV